MGRKTRLAEAEVDARLGKRRHERPHGRPVDQVEGDLVFGDRRVIGSAADTGGTDLESGRAAGDLRVVLLPVLLFRVLRDRALRGPGLQVFGIVVVCEVYGGAAKPKPKTTPQLV